MRTQSKVGFRMETSCACSEDAQHTHTHTHTHAHAHTHVRLRYTLHTFILHALSAKFYVENRLFCGKSLTAKRESSHPLSLEFLVVFPAEFLCFFLQFLDSLLELLDVRIVLGGGRCNSQGGLEHNSHVTLELLQFLSMLNLKNKCGGIIVKQSN